MIQKLAIILLLFVFVSCGSRIVRKSDTLAQLSEVGHMSKSDEVKITADQMVKENLRLFTESFQADSVVISADITKYYNPRTKKESFTQEKKENWHYDFANLKFETLDLEREFFKASKGKMVEREQLNYFKMIFQFWPLLLIIAVILIIVKYRSRILQRTRRS